MSPLWVLPLLVLAAGAVGVALAARRLAAEVAALRPTLDDLRSVATDARSLRVEAKGACARGVDVVDLSRVRGAR